MGRGRAGHRRIIPIIGGTVHGDALSGRVLEVGADWQTVFDDGLAELIAGTPWKPTTGAVIEIINYGLRYGPPEVMAAVARKRCSVILCPQCSAGKGCAINLDGDFFSPRALASSFAASKGR